MERKYYTPSETELHPGFIFEVKEGGEWVKVEFALTPEVIELVPSLPEWEGKIRVACLTRKDIEDCGWKYFRKAENVNQESHWFFANDSHGVCNYSLNWLPDSDRVTISIIGIRKRTKIFDIHNKCKNISKLCQIMMDWGIYPDNKSRK